MKTTILFLLISVSIQAQDLKYASLNILSNSLIGGIGSGIHKQKNETFWQAFKQGAWKGSVGGALNYGSKKMLQISSKNNTYTYIWPARITNSISNSINYNAIQNKPIFSSFYFTAWFINMQFDGKIHWKIDPYTLGSAILLSFNENNSFNLKNSLITGSLFFNRKRDNKILSWWDIKKYGTQGQTFGNTIWAKNCDVYDYVYDHFDTTIINNKIVLIPSPTTIIKSIDKQIVLHEMIHTFQYEQFNINPLTIDKICNKLNINIKHLNINPNFGIIYTIFNISGYYNNIFEKEANNFMK